MAKKTMYIVETQNGSFYQVVHIKGFISSSWKVLRDGEERELLFLDGGKNIPAKSIRSINDLIGNRIYYASRGGLPSNTSTVTSFDEGELEVNSFRVMMDGEVYNLNFYPRKGIFEIIFRKRRDGSIKKGYILAVVLDDKLVPWWKAPINKLNGSSIYYGYDHRDLDFLRHYCKKNKDMGEKELRKIIPDVYYSKNVGIENL
ncbi:MAG: hypothetical protein KJ601_07415 [Nanoarchaeota archaeon]|nr:hypothetical protein [Nanoarchaeota archaeon]